MNIRPETPADYASIHALHVAAFQNRTHEATITALLRLREAYNPQLSLVAEIDGIIVGHALFSPYIILINGQALRAINLAPIGVLPDYHSQGIGGALIEEGHRIAREDGYVLSFLLGHTSYYPRFGYQTHAFGSSEIAVDTASLPANTLDTASPTPNDCDALVALWQEAESTVDMAIQPEASIHAWLAPYPNITATVYRQGDSIVGYTRQHDTSIKAFYASDPDVVQMMARHCAGTASQIKLPLHPQSAEATAFDSKAISTAWDAAMICPLSENAIVADYLANECIGRVIWHTAFDIDG
ncbi:MAG: N-acetyltransferase [Chloroflexota bacterium]